MRRTYRSKKDAPDALNPREVVVDSKFSIFDAFYIHNIKQTKREMSVGASIQFAASNKVRKRNNKKYVKRVKEHEPSSKVSPTQATYLTPDKSIRVNKAADLFDQLLNSSSKNTQLSPILQISYAKKPQIKPKTFGKRKVEHKKYNYSSSDSSDYDKENSTNCEGITNNTSDIKKYQLIVEKETQHLKCVDQSINDMLNHLSIFKNRSVCKGSPIDCKNVNEDSPLCSTPFNEKYRGKSIYNFSPIEFNLENSRESEIVEENNVSIVTAENIVQNNESNNVRKSIILNNIRKSILFNKHETVNKISDKNINAKSSEFTSQEGLRLKCDKICLVTSTEEPFIGFTNKTECNVVNINNSNQLSSDTNIVDNSSVKDAFNKSELNISNENLTNNYGNNSERMNTSLGELPSKPFLGFTDVENEAYSDVNSIQNNIENSVLNSVENDSLYDTCESNKHAQMLKERRPLVIIERLNDSIMQKYLTKINNSLGQDSDSIYSRSSSIDSGDYDSSGILNSSENQSNLYSPSDTPIPNTSENCECSNIEGAARFDNSLEIDKDDICSVFVTKRRRNEITNDSFILADNNSFRSIFEENNDNNNLENVEISIINKQKSNTHDDSNLDQDISNTSSKSIEDCTIISYRDKLPVENNEISFIETDKCELNADEGNLEKSHDCKLSMPYQPRCSDNSSQINKILISQNNMFTNNTNINVHETSDAISNRKCSVYYGDCGDKKPGIVLKPGKQWERSLSIYKRMSVMSDQYSILESENLEIKGRKYRQSVISTIEMQSYAESDQNVSINSRRSTFISKPSRSTIKIIKDCNLTRTSSICSTSICSDLQGFLTEDCDDTVIELSKLSIADCENEITVLEKFDDTSNHRITARDYVLRRCNQADVLLFDECYPDTVLKNCRKIGEGVYGEVFLWRARDGRARVLKIIPIAGNIKVNGEDQKDYSEIISEIVIAMELSALRAPIADIERHLDEGRGIDTLDLHSIENATDIFNEVLAVRCVCGPYPARLLDLWELYDESRGSENDNPAALPPDQRYLVLELANAGQDLEGYTFANAEQAYAVFQQIAFGLAVAEEAFQFEHRDLHWGNVLIAPTDQKAATFVLGGRVYRVRRRGVAATVIDYSLSRLALPAGRADRAALYNDLANDDGLFDAVGDYQFEVYRLMRDKLGNDWKNFEPYTNILWLHYIVDKMITALRYARTNTKIHKHYISKLKEVKNRILNYESTVQFVLTDNEL